MPRKSKKRKPQAFCMPATAMVLPELDLWCQLSEEVAAQVSLDALKPRLRATLTEINETTQRAPGGYLVVYQEDGLHRGLAIEIDETPHDFLSQPVDAQARQYSRAALVKFQLPAIDPKQPEPAAGNEHYLPIHYAEDIQTSLYHQLPQRSTVEYLANALHRKLHDDICIDLDTRLDRDLTLMIHKGTTEVYEYRAWNGLYIIDFTEGA